MYKITLFFALLFSISMATSQELNCLVTINSDQIPGSNKQVFSTLEKALNEFINQTEWTGKEVKPEERINCAILINISAQPAPNRFTSSIQIQAARPVFNANYSSPILSLKDDDFDFRYTEFEPLQYNRNSFDSNLISTIVFYVHVILGIDGDTFKRNGGQKYLKEAENVMLQAQQSGIASWSNQVGKQNRFLLIDNLLSPKLQNFRTVLYKYHRDGLDNFWDNRTQARAKQSLEDSLLLLETLYNKSIGNYLLRVFFDAKADEIVNIYSDGSSTRNKNRLVEMLRKISSSNTNKWKNIE